MRIEIVHQTNYIYEPAAGVVALRLRLFPSQFAGQTPISWEVSVNNTAVEPLFTDGYGDQHALWHTRDRCDGLEVTASGVVETEDKTGVVAGLPRRPPPGVFLRTTPLTETSDAIAKLASAVEGDTTLDRLHALSRNVAKALTYRKDTTGHDTTAAEALDLKQGVCQDFSHIFISAARHCGVPARYVSGYLLADEDQDVLHETHGWAEVFVRDLGWIGFDPSNNICPTERYVRLSCGLDANAAAPIRGSVTGESTVGLQAHVEIGQAQQ